MSRARGSMWGCSAPCGRQPAALTARCPHTLTGTGRSWEGQDEHPRDPERPVSPRNPGALPGRPRDSPALRRGPFPETACVLGAAGTRSLGCRRRFGAGGCGLGCLRACATGGAAGPGEQEPAGGQVPGSPRCQLAPSAGRAWPALPRGRWQNLRAGWFRLPRSPKAGFLHTAFTKSEGRVEQNLLSQNPKPCREGGGRGSRVDRSGGWGVSWVFVGPARNEPLLSLKATPGTGTARPKAVAFHGLPTPTPAQLRDPGAK